jgi:hypothetical protein
MEGEIVKFHKFSEELPLIGKHILVSNEKKQVGMIEFDRSARKVIRKHLQARVCDPFPVYVANAEEEGYVDIENCPFWSYSSSIRLPA